MGMSVSIAGVRDLAGQFAAMAAVKEACEAADVPYPDAVVQFFGGEDWVDENIELLRERMEEVDITAATTKKSGDGEVIWEVDLKDLPADVKAIRVKYG